MVLALIEVKTMSNFKTKYFSINLLLSIAYLVIAIIGYKLTDNLSQDKLLVQGLDYNNKIVSTSYFCCGYECLKTFDDLFDVGNVAKINIISDGQHCVEYYNNLYEIIVGTILIGIIITIILLKFINMQCYILAIVYTIYNITLFAMMIITIVHISNKSLLESYINNNIDKIIIIICNLYGSIIHTTKYSKTNNHHGYVNL